MHRTTKRAKAVQACSSCRKHKSRCELLDHSTSPVRCHRCKVLSVECSYEKTQKPVAALSAPKPPRALARSPEADHRPAKTAPTPRLWSFVEGQGIDWSAPMLAIQHLTTLPAACTTPTEFVNNDLSLAMILPEGRIDYLVDLFNIQYTPWLNFQPIRHSKNPLVDIACSAVAARHLDGTAGNEVRLRLQALTRESIAQMIFNPGAADSVEAVQCLVILSLWEPFGGGPDISGCDTQSLISAAVRMAVKLRLNHASAMVNDLRKGELQDTTDLMEAVERARLWIALTNAESMLCLGTRRTPLSCRCPDDLIFVEFPRNLNVDPDLRDLRLGLSARPFDLFEEGVSISFGSDKEEWDHDIKSVLERMKREMRLLAPLPVVMDRDQFYFQVLHILHGSCRLLVIYHAFWEARSSFPHDPLGQACPEQFMPGGALDGLVTRLARDMLQTSEALLVSFLATPAARLCTAPDRYFSMVALAAGFLVGVKFLVVRMASERGLLGASDLLLARAVAALHRAACGPGHAAHRCALLVQGMLDKWRFRELSSDRRRHTDPPPQAGFRQQADVSAGLGLPHEQGQVPTRAQDAAPVFDIELMFLNSMLADGAAFWDTLVQNQSTW